MNSYFEGHDVKWSEYFIEVLILQSDIGRPTTYTSLTTDFRNEKFKAIFSVESKFI